MTITELKRHYPEFIINQVVTDIVLRGISELKISSEAKTQTAVMCDSCLEAIKGSDWNDIRSIIKRSL